MPRQGKKSKKYKAPAYLARHPELKKYWEMYPPAERKTASVRKWRAIQKVRENRAGVQRRKVKPENLKKQIKTPLRTRRGRGG